MCEAKTTCKAKGRFWVRRDSANLIVCGRHIVGAIDGLRAMDSNTAHVDYHIQPGSSVIVKGRQGKGWR